MSVSEPSDCPAPDFGILGGSPAFDMRLVLYAALVDKKVLAAQNESGVGRCSPAENNLVQFFGGFLGLVESWCLSGALHHNTMVFSRETASGINEISSK